MALPNARVLIHQPYSETGRGQVSDLEIAANEILRMRAQLEEMLAKHSTTPIEKIRDDIERDKILTAEDALAYGLIDQIISTRKMNNAAVALTRTRYRLPPLGTVWHGARQSEPRQGGPERGARQGTVGHKAAPGAAGPRRLPGEGEAPRGTHR